MVISGPAGSGKTTLCQNVIKKYAPKIERVITCTTRVPRPSELNGVDYHFLSEMEFKQKVREDAFYEWAHVHANYYGSLKETIQTRLNQEDLLMIIDVQGAQSLREAAKKDAFLASHLVTIFIMPPSLDVLRERLSNRENHRGEDSELRLRNAVEEIKHLSAYDYCIISRDRETDLMRFSHIYEAEKMRTRGQSLGL